MQRAIGMLAVIESHPDRLNQTDAMRYSTRQLDCYTFSTKFQALKLQTARSLERTHTPCMCGCAWVCGKATKTAFAGEGATFASLGQVASHTCIRSLFDGQPGPHLIRHHRHGDT